MDSQTIVLAVNQFYSNMTPQIKAIVEQHFNFKNGFLKEWLLLIDSQDPKTVELSFQTLKKYLVYSFFYQDFNSLVS